MPHRFDLGEIGGTVLCALLSLVAFVLLFVYVERLPVAMVLAIVLACPLVWLIFWLWSGGNDGGLVQRAERKAAPARPAQPRIDWSARLPAER